MAVNKVVFGDTTVMDLTEDTVTSDTMLEGVTAHDKSGEPIVGSAVIPTVNNGKLTIQKNGTTVATFTANQSTAATANITVPVKVSELTNDSNFVADNPTFTEASSRANIASGETFATILGKIKKFFTDLKTVAFTGSYNDLSNKPTIPTVNNATLTIQKNGTTVKTFTANASSNVTANITVPTNVSELTNDSGYVTTDTKNTAGSTNTSSKIFLVGATSQAANPQTYSHDTAYVGTDGCLYSGGTKVLTAHQDISGKVNKSGDTMTGNLTIQRTSTNEQNSPATLNLWTVDSTNSVTSKGSISAYDGGASGANMVITPNGNLFVGSGEGPYNHYSLYKHSTGEVLYMTSDNQVHIQANGQTIANRLGLMIDNSGNVLPEKADVATNDSGSIGTSNYKWADGYFTNINGVAVGNSPKFTDNNNAVTQTNTTTSANYRVLLSNNANDTTETTTARKSSKITFNPSTGAFYAEGFNRTDITGKTLDLDTLTLKESGSPHAEYYIEKTDGGATNITNRPVTENKPFLLDVEAIRVNTESDFITRQTYRNAANPTHEYVRFCVSGTWGAWTTRVFTDTNNAVTQTATTTDADYEVLFSQTADNVTRTQGARKNNNLTFNPSTGNLKATQLNGVTIGSSPKFTDTDTKNTAGSTDTSSKIFLIGATSQAANPQTYSDNEVYTTSGVLTAKKLSAKALTALTGTGTAGADKGSGVSPRYIPSLWTFNSGVTVANGEVYLIKIPVAGGTYGVWLSLNNGTNYYPVAVSNSTGRFTTQYGNGTVIAVTYESAGKCTCYPKDGGDTTSSVTGIFRVLNDYDANSYVTQTATTTNANYEVLFSQTADNTTRTEGARKTSTFRFNPSTNTLSTTNLALNGGALNLATSGSSSNDSADIVFYYGNGSEKARIWMDDSYGNPTTGPNYRVSGTSSGFQSTLATMQDVNKRLPLTGGDLTGDLFIKSGKFLYLDQPDNNKRSSLSTSSNGTLFVRAVSWMNLCAAQQVQCRNANDTAWVNIAAANISSSRRFKENIQDLTEEEARKLLDVRTVTFDFKEEYAPSSDWEHERFHQQGVIAEEVKDIFPTLVRYSNYENPDEEPIPTFVEYSHFVPYLIKMVQMQQKEIDDLKVQIKELQTGE